MKILSLLFAILLWFAAPTLSFAETKIRVGHFPNITHAQALVAHALSRQGKGWFEQRLGPGTKIEWFIYNAGPSAMEAIFAKSIDLTYVGPGPALNAYTKSNGQEIRLIAGAANGGAGLVVQPDENLRTPPDFRGKKIATPQLGNTQDISCRAWLTAGGLKITQLGGDAQVIPTQNPDQLGLFKAKKIDGVWTVEPWLTRLEQEASGKVIMEEKDTATTVLVSRVKFLNEQRDLAKKFVDRKSTRLNSSHLVISYAVFCLKKKRTIYAAGRSTRKQAIGNYKAGDSSSTSQRTARSYTPPMARVRQMLGRTAARLHVRMSGV